MKILNFKEPITFYVLERHIKGKWRVMFAEPKLLEGAGVFDDVNWGDTSLWHPFSTLSPVFREISIPGTYSLEAAMKAYNHLSLALGQGYPVRLRRITLSIESEVVSEQGVGNERLAELIANREQLAAEKKREQQSARRFRSIAQAREKAKQRYKRKRRKKRSKPSDASGG